MSAMKAVALQAVRPARVAGAGGLPSPVPGAGEVVVGMKAASVNFPDVLIIQNKYQFKPPLPFSPGSELAGVVKEVGEGVTGVKPGDQVIAFTAYRRVRRGSEDRSRAPACRCPQGMDFESARRVHRSPTAPPTTRCATAGSCRPGETLLVLGAAGGVGIAAIEIGKALGARVIACASSDEKLAVCRAARRRRDASTTRARTCASASRRSPAATASTWSTTRSAAPTPSRRCAPSPGAAGSW